VRSPGRQRVVRGIAISCGLAVVAGLAGLGEPTLLMAQTGSSCPLPLDAQFKSIRAFAPIASFLTQEPRCVNCHGGVNPHIEGTGADPEDEKAPVSTVEHGPGRIERQRERARDGTLLIEGACIECHNNMAPKRDGSRSLWMTPPNFLSFVGKDATTLCKQMKRSTHTETEFLGHLRDDNGGNNFGKTAFNGDRGLDKDMYGDIPPARPSISHEALMRLGRAWVDAMGGSFKGDESCGCEPSLKGKFTYIDSSGRDTIKVTGDLVWKSQEQRLPSSPAFGQAGSTVFTPRAGEITVEVEFNNPGLMGSVCKGIGRKTFSVDGLTRGALRHMSLEIADDGRYHLTLVIPDTPDPFPSWEFEGVCIFPNVTARQPVPVRHVAVVLGEHRGTLDAEQRIVGQLPSPIRRGPRTITGNWSFQ
jgi:hypothetical protein